MSWYQQDPRLFFVSAAQVPALKSAVASSYATDASEDTRFQDALEESYWSFRYDAEGNINNIVFDDNGHKDDGYELLCVIAPFVKNGSFVELIWDGGESKRYVFFDGQIHSLKPTIIWDTSEIEGRGNGQKTPLVSPEVQAIFVQLYQELYERKKELDSFFRLEKSFEKAATQKAEAIQAHIQMNVLIELATRCGVPSRLFEMAKTEKE